MIRAVSRASQLSFKKVNPQLAVRSFSEKLHVPTDLDQAGGRDRLAVDHIAQGAPNFFNKLPIVPPSSAGTLENPILVPSAHDTRTIGFEDPNTLQVYWFNLTNQFDTYYVPLLGLHFKLAQIPTPTHH